MARHPLQRCASPSTSFSLLLHAAGIASFSYSFYFLMHWDTVLATSYGWYFQFLTIIGLAASLAAFALGGLADLTGSGVLFQLKNILATVATPLEILISVLYWSLHVIDPTLIVQPGFELAMPVDIGFHLAPAAFLTLDLLLLSPPWTISAYSIMAISTVIGFSYWYWVEMCFTQNGWYPYPLFGLLTTAQRVGLFTFSAVLVTVSSSALKVVYGAVNGYNVPSNRAKATKKRQ